MIETQLSLNHKAFLNLLNAKQVEYLVVGGFAVRYHGYLRSTQYLDVWISRHPDNAAKLVDVCQIFTMGMDDLTVDPFLHERRIVRVDIPPCNLEILDPIVGQGPAILATLKSKQADRIDILTIQSGVNFTECFQDCVVDEVDGITIKLVNLRHLKAIKQAGARPQDLIDVENLP